MPNTKVAIFVETMSADGPAVNVRAAVSMAINANTIIHPSILVISPFQGRSRLEVSRPFNEHVKCHCKSNILKGLLPGNSERHATFDGNRAGNVDWRGYAAIAERTP